MGVQEGSREAWLVQLLSGFCDSGRFSEESSEERIIEFIFYPLMFENDSKPSSASIIDLLSPENVLA
jgi:hypothetical protein